MDVAELLGPTGPLARQVAGFAPRLPQQRMAQAVAAALADDGILIVEAGAGTGKTFAYLVPALWAGMRVLISTGTRHLQDQLYQQDLPVVRRALGAPVAAALLKGRSNYLCWHRLHLTEQEGRLTTRTQAFELQRVADWAQRTRDGDIAGIAGVPESSPLWPSVTATADNCLGADCPELEDCFFFKARRAAQAADVLVVNHHLFCADLALRETGSELLPGVEAVILDEAHQLPEIASHFFGQSISGRQLRELAHDTMAEQARDAADFPDLRQRAEVLLDAEMALRTALGSVERRAPWRTVADYPEVQAAINQLNAVLASLEAALREAAPRGKGLESCLRRLADLQGRLTVVAGEQQADAVSWFETHARGFTLSLTPLDIAPAFQNRMAQQPGAWIFTSATLAVGDGFTHFAARLGLGEYVGLRLDSPFDFARNALLYQPPALPDPAAPNYTAALLTAALPVLEASRGRAFLLFTSHRALREAEHFLADHRLDYPLLVQGSAPKAILLREFRTLGNAVLLGTASFWEGVDVRGEALSCVVIDRLPFASPGDPVLQARIEALRQRGDNPFQEYQLPQAVIALKQGAGRLIRDVNDRGVLLVGDPRLWRKSYGQIFRASLPPMSITRDLAQVRAFFAEETAGRAD